MFTKAVLKIRAKIILTTHSLKIITQNPDLKKSFNKIKNKLEKFRKYLPSNQEITVANDNLRERKTYEKQKNMNA